MEWIYAWVPCTNYLGERKREINRKTPSQYVPKRGNERVRMHELCMSMCHAKEIASWVQPNPNLSTHKFQHINTYLNA